MRWKKSGKNQEKAKIKERNPARHMTVMALNGILIDDDGKPLAGATRIICHAYILTAHTRIPLCLDQRTLSASWRQPSKELIRP